MDRTAMVTTMYFFADLCGAGGDFRGVVCLGFLFVMCAVEGISK